MMHNELKGFGTEIDNEFKALQAENRDLSKQLETFIEQNQATITSNTARLDDINTSVE